MWRPYSLTVESNHDGALLAKRRITSVPTTLMDIAQYSPPKHNISPTYSKLIQKGHSAILKDLSEKTKLSLEELARKAKEKRLKKRKEMPPPAIQSQHIAEHNGR